MPRLRGPWRQRDRGRGMGYRVVRSWTHFLQLIDLPNEKMAPLTGVAFVWTR